MRNQTIGGIELQTLRTIAVLAIALGLALQMLVVIARLGLDGTVGDLLVETVGAVTWSVLVCFGVAAGTALLKAQPNRAGLVALVCTPLAFALSKGAQAGMGKILGSQSDAVAGPLVLTALVKAAEYGFLAFMLAALAARGITKLGPHLVVGLGIALSFGGALLIITALTARPALTPAKFVVTSFNELLFPIGCAFAVFVARGLAGVVTQQQAEGE